MFRRLKLLILFSFFINHVFFAQQKKYSDASLIEVVKNVERQSSLIFNYDPELLSEYFFSGELIFNNAEKLVAQLLHDTPLDFELNGNSVVVFMPEKKEFRICGTVLDAASQAPLMLSNIYADDQAHGAQSAEDGFFEFRFFAHKNQKITVSYLGYLSKNFMAQEFAEDNCQKIFLELDKELFGREIVVTDYMLDGITEGEGYGSVKINYSRLSNNHTNIEQDILKTAQLIPGVTSIDESASNLQIRGGTADQNLVLWEGATLYGPGHLFGMISTVNPFVVDQVKIYKGVFEPSYDNRVGGIVDMSLSDSVSTGFHGGVGTTFTESHAYLEFPIINKKMSLLATGRKTINGIFNSPTLVNYSNKVFQETTVEENKEEEDVEQGLDFFDWNVKLLIKPTERILFKASYFRAVSDFKFNVPFYDEDLEVSDDVRFDSEAMNFSLQLNPANKWRSELAFTNSNYENNNFHSRFDLEDDELSYLNIVFNNIKDYTFSFSNQLSVHEDWDVGFGYGYDLKQVEFNIESFSIFEREFGDSNFVRGNFHNLFTSLQYQKKDWQINGGLRANYHQQAGVWDVSPRLNIQYAANEYFKLKFSTGILHQYISQLKQFGENFLDMNNQVWVLSREETEEETIQVAKKAATGFVFNKNGWLLDVEGYYHLTEGLTTFSPSFGTNEAVTDYSPGNATSRGIDMLLKKRWGAYNFWVNYSLSKVEFEFPEINDRAFPATNDQRHNLNLINSWSYKNWDLSVSYQFRTGLPYSQPVGLGMNEEDDEIDYEIEYEEINENTLDDYHRLDLGLRYTTDFDRSKTKAEFAFSIINLLDHDNTFSREYYVDDIEDDDDPELFFIEKRLLKRTPQLLVRFRW
ncbi:MAG: carboxypeptidase-like regulatory domain-containing protein [Bacteroidota bacterium]